MSGQFFFSDGCEDSWSCCYPFAYTWRAVYEQPAVVGAGIFPDGTQSDWIAFAASPYVFYGIRSDGSLWGWSQPLWRFGQPTLGDGDVTPFPVPRLIDEGPWQYISTYSGYGYTNTFTLGLKQDGTLWAWGDNSLGQLGNGFYGGITQGEVTESGLYSAVGFSCKGRARISTSVQRVEIQQGGEYRRRPTVSFVVQSVPCPYFGNERGLADNSEYNPEGAAGATGEAVMSFKLMGCTVANPGSGYTSVPTAVVESSETVTTPSRVSVWGSFSIDSVEVVDGGSGYTGQPTLTPSGLSGGGGFEYECVIEGGKIVSVDVTSPGSGYRTPDTKETFFVNVAGGGGAGAVLKARLRDGFIYSADPSVAGSGYKDVPTITVTGGGGQDGEITGDWRGPVVKVNVTNGGGGYTEIDQTYSGGTGTSGVYPCRYVNVAFDRDSEDDLTRSATAKARLTPVTVSEVTLLSGHDFNQPYFDERTGELLEFNLTNVYAAGWNTNDPPAIMPDVEAKIVGDGLTWDTGEPLEVTYQDTVTPPSGITPGTTVRRFSVRYSPTERQYGCRPQVVILKKEPAFNLKPESMPTVGTVTLTGGIDVGAQLYATRSASKTYPIKVWINPVASSRYPGGIFKCDTTVCAILNYGVFDLFDAVGYFNGIGGQLVDEPFSIQGGLTGSPQATAGAGGAEISLTNFDGTCYYSVSDRGDSYNQIVTKAKSGQTQNGSACISSLELTSYTVSFTTFTTHQVPDTWRPQITLSSYAVSQKESYETMPIPSTSWRGPRRPRRDSVYCSFSSLRSSQEQSYVQRGCWKLLREGEAETILAGGQHDHEPMVTVYPYTSLAMEQISGNWIYAEAGVSVRVNGQEYAACAINDSGELYVWGGAFETLPTLDLTNYKFPTYSGSLPQPIGKMARITCSWNEDVYPHDGTNPIAASTYAATQQYFSVIQNRFDVPDPPQFASGSRPSDIASSRRSDDWKFYPDQVYNDAFGVGSLSSDEKGSGEFWTRTSRIDFVKNEFTSNPSTSWAGGFGYTSPPLVHFRKTGNPLLSVSATLESLPAFSKVFRDYAIATGGKLWNLNNGWVARGEGYSLVARKATFSTSAAIDGWVVSFGDSGGYQFDSMTPEEACGVPGPWLHCNSGTSPGQVAFGGRCSQEKSPVTHETIESISVVRHYAIIFDDGGSGFDDYSAWKVKVTAPPVVSLVDLGGTTTYGGDYFTEPGYYMETDYQNAKALNEAFRVRNQACGVTGSPDTYFTNPSLFQAQAKTLPYKQTVSHERTSAIQRSETESFYIQCKTWRGSLFPTASFEGGSRTSMNKRTADAALYDEPVNAYFIDGPFEGGQEPTIEFECVSGESSYTSPPSYRIIAIAGSLQRSNGPAEMNGSWTDFDTESSDRKIAKAPFKEAKGLKAPEDENHFVKIVNGIGLREDGSLWKLGWMNSPSLVTGHLEYTVSSPGSGYETPVTAEVTTQPDGVATATATFDGRLVAVGVVSGGSGYRTPPTLTIEGGASATAVIEGPVDAVEVTDGGSGYKTSPRVRFSQPGFSAFAKAKLAGSISEIVVIDGGSGYKSAPDVQIVGTGSGASATAVIAGRVSEINVSNSGAKYTSPPTITISGGGGSGATAVAVMKQTGATYAVKSVKITSGGSGYSSTPSVSFSGGEGNGAAASAEIDARVTSISVDSGGEGYEEDVTVSMSGGAKAIAKLDLSVSSISVTHGGAYRAAPTVTFETLGSIESITLDDGGDGYTSAPTVLIAGGVGVGAEAVATIDASVASVTVLDGGMKYSQSSPPEVKFTGGCTEPAEGTAVVGSSGQITGIQITNQGSGYTTPPTVSLVGRGGGARLVAVLSGTVSKLTLTKVGSGYDEDAMPTVMFIGGGGDGASATVSVEKAGSGASATATINGSVIYATVSNAGSMLQSNPSVSVSGGGNDKVQDLQDLLDNGEITQQEFDDRSSEYVAVLQAGIEGLVTSTQIDNAGENYASTSGSLATFDRHGKRVSRVVGFIGSSSYPSGSRFVSAAVSTDDGGGGTITSIPSPTQKYCRRPAVVFQNTYTATIYTRLTVSSLAIKTGGTLSTQPKPIAQNNINVEDRESTSSHDLGVLDPRGATNALCERVTRFRGITPYRFLDSSALAYRRPYKRAPQFAVESLTAGGATSTITLDEDGFIVDPDNNEKMTSNKPLGVSAGSDYSSGLVGRTATPGLALFTSPTLTLTVSDGEVTSAQKSSDGNLSDYATNPAWASYYVSVVVHGGGGTGAEVAFDESGVPYIKSGGTGYTTTPSATVIPNIERVYGKEHSLEEPLWPTWTPVMSPSSTCVAEYVSGSTDGEYMTLQGDVPVTEDGVYPMFQDGFVSYAALSQGSSAAFIKHFSDDPEVELIGDDCDVEAVIDAKIVRWSSTFHSDGDNVIAQREED